MNQEALAFWQNHSVNFLKMALQTDKRENLAQPDGYGKLTRECGDTMEIFLIVRNGVIRSAAFQSDGCIYSVVCANAVVHLAQGKSVEVAGAMAPEMVALFLETLPEEEMHCAEQAVQTLRLALADARETERSPWKKFYPRKP